MHAITLRNVPPEIARLIRRKAVELRTSLNRAVISLLQEATGLRPAKREARNHDLDRLAGTWSQAEAAEFDLALTRQRAVDPDLWK